MRFTTFMETTSQIYYHGGTAGLSEFKPGYRGIIYFTKDKDYARSAAERYYGKKESQIYEVTLNIKKTATYKDPKVIDIILSEFPDMSREDIIQAFDEGYDPYEYFENSKVIGKLKTAGYDSVSFDEEGQTSIGVFSPKQAQITGLLK